MLVGWFCGCQTLFGCIYCCCLYYNSAQRLHLRSVAIVLHAGHKHHAVLVTRLLNQQTLGKTPKRWRNKNISVISQIQGQRQREMSAKCHTGKLCPALHCRFIIPARGRMRHLRTSRRHLPEEALGGHSSLHGCHLLVDCKFRLSLIGKR